MNIRCENSLDYQTIAEVNIQAFEQKDEAHLVEQIRHSDRYIPELSLVAELNGVVVGHILFSYINLVGEESFQVLGLAPLSVRPDLQRQGIGSALVLAGLARANAIDLSTNPQRLTSKWFNPHQRSVLVLPKADERIRLSREMRAFL